jgi:hypothetical protein
VIARSIRLAQASASTASIVLLVGFNLIPLAGVVLWGWNVATLLILYWVENGIVGILNVPKMLLASGSGDASAQPGNAPVGRPLAGTAVLGGPAAKAALVPFFLVHYGVFWVVHGVFVFLLPQFAAAFAHPGIDPGTFTPFPGQPGFEFAPGGSLDALPARSTGPDMTAVAWGAVGLAISHTASFLVNFVGHGEYRRVSVAQQMFAPYGRLMILHLTILFGAFVSIALGSPIGAVIVLVLLKTGVDLAFHLREHGALTAPPRPREEAPV